MRAVKFAVNCKYLQFHALIETVLTHLTAKYGINYEANGGGSHYLAVSRNAMLMTAR